MFKKLVKSLIRRDKPSDEATKNVKQDAAVQLMTSGDLHGAVNAFREYLKIDPFNVGALNNLGACLIDLGNDGEAAQAFELAYSLDDTYIPGIVNHARMCFEKNKTKDGLAYLRQAKICAPQFTHVDTVYASYCLRMGEVARACHYQKKAWLASFDKMRYANSHLFNLAYHDIDEAILAKEHRFWAETVHPLGLKIIHQPNAREDGPAYPKPGQKIRIGYWSPDLRNHSVRFFFRPLLENHDASKFETFVYHDGPLNDAQTELIEKASAQFFRCYDLSDTELTELMLSHELDILVELAGHSSYNRITLMQQRFAPVQMTALGYPPTVGLPTIDVKVLDRHVVTGDNSASFYTEYPLALPSSFWCFDPIEEVPVTPEPPVAKNGYITFACVGNLAKINQRMLRCWKAIFDEVPGCRFLIRSINFENSEAEVAMRGHLAAAGIDLDMVDMHKPTGGSAFFGTYSEIDIILDTFPFNGGTTTCFAAYMGVPVVSLSGQSLISRMGLSILSNLEVPHLAVATEEDYVVRAVELANDLAFLRRFRQEARALFKQSSLGNGQLFAQEFEQACQALLDQKHSGAPAHQSTVSALPAEELVRRGYAVLGHDQPEAAKRILAHCLLHHPESGSAKLLAAQLLVIEQGPAAGVAYIAPLVDGFTPNEQVGALIAMTRWCMLIGELDQARHWLDRLLPMTLEDDFDRWQVQLHDACCQAYAHGIEGEPFKATDPVGQPRHCRVLIACDSQTHFDTTSKQIGSTCLLPRGWRVSYERCGESQRIDAYRRALGKDDADVLVLLQKNTTIHHPLFFQEVVAALQDCDVLGFAGATRWHRMDWRTDEFAHKAAGFMTPSSEVAGFCEIQWFGPRSGPLVNGLAVLDGHLLAVVPSRVRHVDFDEALLGAEQMIEEDWTHTAFQAGLRLSVHRGLGVLMAQMEEPDMRERTPAMMSLLDKRGFDPFAIEKTDAMYISASMASVTQAIHAMGIFSRVTP